MTSEIPKFHETFIPILKSLEDGKAIHYKALLKRVRDNFYANLPEELLTQKTKTGDFLILNRIDWGRVYLKQAKLIQQPERALVQITEKGRQILKRGSITQKELKSDPDFLAHRKGKDLENKTKEENRTPEDIMDAGFELIEHQVKSDLLEKFRNIDPYEFENVVLKLFSAMGYGEFKTTSKSGDGGIDGIINQDKLGLEKIYIQAKRYGEGNKVREPLIRDFIGAMSGDTKKGIFVTTSTFDDSAIRKAKEAHHVIKLIDGNLLVDLMHKHNIGVQIKDVYEVKQIDEDFFEL